MQRTEGLAPTQGLRWNCEPISAHAFPRLRLQRRRHLVKLPPHVASLPITDPAARATPLTPEQWQAMLPNAPPVAPAGSNNLRPSECRGSELAASRGAVGTAAGPQEVGAAGGAAGQVQRRTVVLDVRNGYEWDAGHFQGAERPLEVGRLRSVCCRDSLPAPCRHVCAGTWRPVGGLPAALQRMQLSSAGQLGHELSAGPRPHHRPKPDQRLSLCRTASMRRLSSTQGSLCLQRCAASTRRTQTL